MTILYFLSSLKRKYFVPRFIIFLFSVSLRQLETKQQEESTEDMDIERKHLHFHINLKSCHLCLENQSICLDPIGSLVSTLLVS